LKLRLLTNTLDIDTVVATSMLTTTSGALPSTLFERLRSNPCKVQEIVGRVEAQHGSILEHNRFVWELEAQIDEVNEVLLDTSFLTFTKLSEDQWLLSGNLRTIAEYYQQKDSLFTKALVDSIFEVTPTLHHFIRSLRR
jgi:hypothetical protein